LAGIVEFEGPADGEAEAEECGAVLRPEDVVEATGEALLPPKLFRPAPDLFFPLAPPADPAPYPLTETEPETEILLPFASSAAVGDKSSVPFPSISCP